MANKTENPVHPGAFIRSNIIPSGMSVKDAAKRLGVGRPALSNLLNGNSSLSSDMAIRLEKAFGADSQTLLELQASFDRYEKRSDGRGVAVRSYVPVFLTIKARQIQHWADSNLDARHLLPVLLRKLIHSTGRELCHVDFPGYDNAERKGPDGVIDANAATPWIPEGRSYWEFGTNKDPNAKADNDYAARLTSVSPSERAKCTFVFVTPRNWPGKGEWAQTKNAAGDWKAVKAFDASDLEQWLEESIPAQIWLAEQFSIPISGCETLDQCWKRWTAASEPNIPSAIFESSVTSCGPTFKVWLEKQSERPFVVAADSREEALAFIACLFQEDTIAPQVKDLATVFESAQTLRKLVGSSSPFIPIVCTEEAERELATIYRRFHCIVVRPRNAIDSEPDIALDLLGHDAFEKALGAMGINGDNAERLARESGRSPTILRRRLSKIDAIRIPAWTRNVEIARSLIPLALVGAWHTQSDADREIVSVLASKNYQEVEENVTCLLRFDDCPVWSSGQYRGVASKIDALFAINKVVTERDLKEFFRLAEYVLSERDPALDLPEDQRWAAGLYGKVRNHSAALRQGICETLVILSVHGNNLFLDRLGINIESYVSMLIRRLLTPLTLEKLLSHDNDLPRYAEAAPNEFLKIVEADLQRSNPIVIGILKPVDSSVFGGCPRTGLLWALECLAWRNLGRVSIVLAKLSRTVINDNWANKPVASLGAIYRSWMPQTTASLKERMKTLEMLTKRFPDIGWQICIEQFGVGSRMGLPSYRPHWRSDASGAGQPVTEKEAYEFSRKALDLALAWSKHDLKTLGDLVERLQGMPDDDQIVVWDLIDAWATSESDEKVKADLREKIRRYAFTRHGQRRELNTQTKHRARTAYAKLEAQDPIVRHAWLFVNEWVEESADEIEDESLDFVKRDEKIHKLRVAAMKEIWAKSGFNGLSALLADSEAPYTIGRYLVPTIKGPKAQTAFLRRCLSITGDQERKVDFCIQGFLLPMDDHARDTLVTNVANSENVVQVVRLFQCMPFRQGTWRLLDRYSEEIQKRYWQKVSPYWNRHNEADLIEIVDRLLEAKRPRAAFHAAHRSWSQVETSRLKRLLLAVATIDAEPTDHYKLDTYHISAALNSLDGRTGVSSDEMAQLEFLFIKALDHSKHGIPNLERQIAESPHVFVQAVALTYKRRDDNQDSPEWYIEDAKRRSDVASATHSLLDRLRRVPGMGRDNKINTEALLAWVTEVRRLCVEHGRAVIGDQQIGQLLSKAPGEEDGSWPCLPVCEVMEKIASQEIARGFNIGVYNGRAAHWRDVGGKQERELAAKYRDWAKQRAFDYPYVESVLETIAAGYDREAEWHDSEAKIRKRLPY